MPERAGNVVQQSWNACTQDPHSWMRAIECHPGFAGYIQAIGVIGTIIAAVIIASRQSRSAARLALEEKKIREAKEGKTAILLALRLSSLLSDLAIKLKSAGDIVERLPELSKQISEDVDSVLYALLLNVTWDESIFANFIFLPEESAKTVARLLYSAARFDRETDMALRFVAKHPGRLNELADKLRGNIRDMKADLHTSQSAFHKLPFERRPDWGVPLTGQ